ncbi:MAG TPA: PqqD family peptide modification chaperone [Gaiellaceae bacterium]|jgi:hypothetical protein|nr:PqqD family peptide modification chaperone [Gaiellaceae bacterium]
MHPESARFRLAADRAVAKVIDGDAIVIDTITGRYYSLEGASETAWTLLCASYSLAEAAEALKARYETGGADVISDLGTLATELVAENLLVPADGVEPPAAPTRPDGPPVPYTTPALTVFRDMEDLLAFDPPLPVSDVSVWTAGPDRS